MSAGIRSVTGRALPLHRHNNTNRGAVMKTQLRRGVRQFKLKVKSYANPYYIDRIAKLENSLARKPRALQINIIGVGVILSDTALLIRSILMARSPKTQLIINARSSLQGGSVLVSLLDDRRSIRDDARV